MNVTVARNDVTVDVVDAHARAEVFKWIHDELIVTIDQPKYFVLVFLYGISFLTGLIGNSLVIFTFVTSRRMRTTPNFFMVNLAVCDLMVVCFNMPFMAAMAAYNDWVYGAVWCKLTNVMQGVAVISSIFTLTVISRERFFAVRKPMKARSNLTQARAIKLIAGIYLLSGVIALPLVFTSRKKTHNIEGFVWSDCREVWPSQSWHVAYSIFILVTIYIAPVSVILYGYCRIKSLLLQRDASLYDGPVCPLGRRATNSEVRYNNSRRKLAKLLVLLASLFALSWLPYQLVVVIKDLFGQSLKEKNPDLMADLYNYALWIGLTNSSLNPICYLVISSKLRQELRQSVVRCCCHGHHSLRQQQSITLMSNI